MSIGLTKFPSFFLLNDNFCLVSVDFFIAVCYNKSQ